MKEETQHLATTSTITFKTRDVDLVIGGLRKGADELRTQLAAPVHWRLSKAKLGAGRPEGMTGKLCGSSIATVY